MQKVTIIGGGIIGLCCAYYLNKEGHDVTIIERGNITDGCSFGNMGFVSPSHFMPLASPGIISEGLKYMLNSSSPFYVKPRINIDFLKWSYHFYKNCQYAPATKNATHLHNILKLSRLLINDLKMDLGDTFSLEEKGCLMMCRQQTTLGHEFGMAKNAEKLGLSIQRLNASEVQQLEPDVEVAVAGAVLFKDDCHFDPAKLMNALKTYLENKGVRFQLGATVTSFDILKHRVCAVNTDNGKFQATQVVIATGSWLPEVAKMLGIKMLLQPGKGYSYTYGQVEKNIHYPAILVDGRCAVTPWGQKLRIGGTMELSGFNNNVLIKRMHGIYTSVKKFYPELCIEPPSLEKVWHGLRPVTPDGLPYIGRAGTFENVIFAGGHAMLGMSMGAATGKIVCQLLENKKTEIDISSFRIDRF